MLELYKTMTSPPGPQQMNNGARDKSTVSQPNFWWQTDGLENATPQNGRR